MAKHLRDELLRSFFGSPIDPEKDEEVERAKTEVERKTFDFDKHDQYNGYNDGKERLVNWIEDFDKHDQSLYERYICLTEELRKKADGKHGKDSSSSSSDSDEKERLHGEYETALSETQKAQNTIRELNSEAEKWNDESPGLLTENAGVETELELPESEIARPSTMLKVGEKEGSSLTLRISQLEDVIEHGENKVQGLVTQSIELSEKIDDKERAFWILLKVHNNRQKEATDKLEIAAKVISEPCQMQEQKTSLSSKILQLEDDKKQAENKISILETELGQLREKLEEKERDLLNQLELESLVGQETESETLKQEIANIISAINRSKEGKKTLLEQFKGLEQELDSMRNQILESKEQLKGKSRELSKSLNRVNTFRKELEKRKAEHQKIPEDKKKLDSQVEGLYQEINTLWNKKNEVEEELKKKTAERRKILEDNIELDFQTERLYQEIKTLWNQKYEVEEKLKKTAEHKKTAKHQRILEDKQNEKLKELSAVSLLKQMELLQSERSQPGTQIERSKQESEDLKREISTMSNDLCYAEKLRSVEELLSQKEEEQKVVEDTLKGMMFAYDEVQVQVSAEVDDMMTEIDAFYVEFEENFGLLKSRVNEIANKITMRKQ